MICPNEPTGNSSLASWCRKLVRWCRSLELQSGVGYRVKKGTNGTTLELEHTPAGKAAGTATRYRVKAVHGDYLSCHTWDGSTEGSSEVLIAKPQELRHSVTSQVINGQTVSYGTYAINAGVCTRTASASGEDDQDEMVLPVWKIAGTTSDSEIFADEPSGGTGVVVDDVPLTLIDDNRNARCWCHLKPEP